MDSLTTSASYSWQDEAHSSIFNRRSTLVPEWGMMNVRAIRNSADNRFKIIGFINKHLRVDPVRQPHQWLASCGRHRGVPIRCERQPGWWRNRPLHPQELQYCGSTAATTIQSGGAGLLAESCLIKQEAYRMPV